ncbi:hypothetical protein AVEN_245926-1 [Araneus ventricosus]|uniref:Uncharacterized protein n=1 Tax=Araneus ventricosus TaxID=182803 RepID=A0A4Y2PZU7_ARAVE|nr:hypothetical protein AVEN_245926-1 [Araneus ventricosus]
MPHSQLNPSNELTMKPVEVKIVHKTDSSLSPDAGTHRAIQNQSKLTATKSTLLAGWENKYKYALFGHTSQNHDMRKSQLTSIGHFRVKVEPLKENYSSTVLQLSDFISS